jgi:type VI secretion system secreted protein VgrG
VGAAAIVMSFGGLAVLAATTVNLETATSFAVLAGTGVTNTGTSTVSGDLGTYPTASVTGFPPGVVKAPYTTFAADSVALGAKNDLTTAYNQAAEEGSPTSETADLTGLKLGPGVYQTSSDGALTLSGTLTLDAGGDASAVFIFQTGSSLTTGPSSTVSLIDGGSPCNVFWQVGSSATLDGPTFVGTVMASTSITLGSGVTVDGRILAGTGDVTLISDTIDASACITTASLPTPTATPASTATPAAATTVPASGAGGTSPLIGAGVLVTLGGLVLLGAGVTVGIIRRRRFPSV